MTKSKHVIFDVLNSLVRSLNDMYVFNLEAFEVYFSSVKKDIFKGWKLHKHMTLNLVVPVGEVLFCFKDERENSGTFNKTYQIKLSQDPYFRLTVPARIWFGFKGIEHGLNLICNVADIPHDPNEVLMREINEIKMDIDI